MSTQPRCICCTFRTAAAAAKTRQGCSKKRRKRSHKSASSASSRITEALLRCITAQASTVSVSRTASKRHHQSREKDHPLTNKLDITSAKSAKVTKDQQALCHVPPSRMSCQPFALPAEGAGRKMKGVGTLFSEALTLQGPPRVFSRSGLTSKDRRAWRGKQLPPAVSRGGNR